ncbi:unnamed protein product [Closterium sp. Naga37s-1]|nr:unnamed protein product [Closterium sp. Naga37s-1]
MANAWRDSARKLLPLTLSVLLLFAVTSTSAARSSMHASPPDTGATCGVATRLALARADSAVSPHRVEQILFSWDDLTEEHIIAGNLGTIDGPRDDAVTQSIVEIFMNAGYNVMVIQSKHSVQGDPASAQVEVRHSGDRLKFTVYYKKGRFCVKNLGNGSVAPPPPPARCVALSPASRPVTPSPAARRDVPSHPARRVASSPRCPKRPLARRACRRAYSLGPAAGPLVPPPRLPVPPAAAPARYSRRGHSLTAARALPYSRRACPYRPPPRLLVRHASGPPLQQPWALPYSRRASSLSPLRARSLDPSFAPLRLLVQSAAGPPLAPLRPRFAPVTDLP